MCPHFGECGGCSWQHLNYATQIKLKQEALQEIMQEFRPRELAVVASPEEFGYRARMDYVCSYDPFHPPQNRMGLRKRKQFRHVIDLEECHLIDPKLFVLVHKVYAQAQQMGIPNYDLVSGKGELRYMVTRTTGTDYMLIMITRSRDLEAEVEKLAQFAILQGFVSVYWLEQPQLSDVSFGEVVKFWGDQYLSFRVNGGHEVSLRIGPNNFFQNNIPQFNQLLKYVSEHLESADMLLDLYCGVGTIGISLADKFKHVTSVELEPESIVLAKTNANENKVENISFFAGNISNLQVEVELPMGTDQAVAIVDPPRAGLTPKGVAELLQLRPRQIIYISCNPITQAQDLHNLLPQYEIDSMCGFDMFPQTPHLENVVVLHRK